MENLQQTCKHCYDSLEKHRSVDSACPVRDVLQPQRVIRFNPTQVFEKCGSPFGMRIRARAVGLRLDMTDVQNSDLGSIVRSLYLTKNAPLLELLESIGYPYNGGEHSLCVYGSRDDLIAWIDLVIERFSGAKEAYVLYALRSALRRFES